MPATVAHQQNQHQLSLTMKQHRFARNPSMVWHTKKSHRFGLELPFEFSSTAASHRPQAHRAPSRVLSEALWLLHLLLCLPRNRNMLQIKAAAPKLFIHHNDDMVGLHLRRKLGRSQAREIGAGPGLAIGKSRTVYIRSNDEINIFHICHTRIAEVLQQAAFVFVVDEGFCLCCRPRASTSCCHYLSLSAPDSCNVRNVDDYLLARHTASPACAKLQPRSRYILLTGCCRLG